ncbi:MAG TPA: TlpA disulfide reductase family protein [Ktedonobacteraceae bacterium]|nr:TlpA disulfide reductase family protein [Ktedonobacteraceae bacterium]
MEDKRIEPDVVQVEKQRSVPKRKGSRKRSIIIFSVITLLNVLVLAFLWTQLLTPAQTTTQGSSQTNTNDPLLGHAAPNFTLDALNMRPDAPVSLSSFKGKTIVLNVWNSTCLPCMDEAHLLQSMWQKVKPQGVVFIGIDFQDMKGDGVNFLKKYGVTYQNVLDVSGSTAISYGVTATPETLFINRQGVVVSRVIAELTEQSFQSNLQLITR